MSPVDLFGRFFLTSSQEAIHAYRGHYDYAMVVTSILISIIASFCAFEIVAQQAGKRPRKIWLPLGAIVLGLGVWSMHFIGMLAFRLNCGVAYNPWVTAGSMIPAILAAAVVLEIDVRGEISSGKLLLAGLVMGLGIGTMHYLGMAAIRLNGVLRYDPGLFILSLGAVTFISAAALWARASLRSSALGRDRFIASLAGGTTLGIAISSMHYLAMSAAHFIRPNVQTREAIGVYNPIWLYVVLILVMGLLVIGVGMIFAYRKAEISPTASAARSVEMGERQLNLILPSLVLFLGLGSVAIAGNWVERGLTVKAQKVFDLQSQIAADAIRRRMNDYQQSLRAGVALLDSSESVDRAQWHVLVDALEIQRNFPGIQGVGWSQVIRPEDLEIHIRKLRAEGFPEYRVFPEGNREIYTSIVFLEPFDKRNQRAFGFDMFSEPVRRQAMILARDTGAAALSGKVTLVQEGEGKIQAGALMYLPVYRKNAPLTAIDDRRRALLGFVYAPFRMEDLMDGVLSGVNLDSIGVRIYDGEARLPQAVLYDSNGDSLPREDQESFSEERTIGVASARGSDFFSSVRSVEIAQRKWTLEFFGGSGFDADLTDARVGWLSVAGITLSIALAMLVRSLLMSRLQSHRLGMALQAQRALQEQLVQSEKMVALGSLAGGIAHEINTPMQYIGDNLRFIQTSAVGLFKALNLYQRASKDSRVLAEAESAVDELDLPYIEAELPAAIEQALEGAAKVSTIVQAIKEYSHPGHRAAAPFDFNAAIETAVLVTRNQWKYVAEVSTDLAPDLPLLVGFKQEIEQVLVNLIVNAAQAIEERKADTPGGIIIATRRQDDWVRLTISDTGAGIPPEILGRIFDMFFTTKPPGAGTGQGLAICQSIIMMHHGGTITVQSRPDEGTMFTIMLPLAGPPASAIPANEAGSDRKTG